MSKTDWITKENLILLEGWARDGLTNEQIAHNIGINPDTLYEWKKTKSEISEALKKGREVVDYQVENALLEKALKEKNVVAMIYWLKNRRPDKWREKPVEKIDFEDIPRFINSIKEEE